VPRASADHVRRAGLQVGVCDEVALGDEEVEYFGLESIKIGSHAGDLLHQGLLEAAFSRRDIERLFVLRAHVASHC
jgi:hypothetical protein